MGDGAGLLPLVLTAMCRSNYLVSKHVMLKDASDLRFAFQASAKYPKPKGISSIYTDKYSDPI